MPIGVIINALSVVIGGILGALVGHKLSPKFKAEITLVFGVCSMGMGISTIGLMENMPAVIFSIVIGTGIGLAIHLGDRINAGAGIMQRGISKFIKNTNSELSEEEFMNTLVTIIVLFCASGTGIYGSIVAGMSGDHSVLISEIYPGSVYGSYFCMQSGNGSMYGGDSAVYYFSDPVLRGNSDLPADYTNYDQ